jgi:hypothetical protein
MVRLTAMLALLLLFLPACGPPPEPITAAFGEEVSLRVEQVVTFDDELRVKFLGIESDTRCPPDVECTEEGSASISLEVENITDHIIDPRTLGMSVHDISRGLWFRGFDTYYTDGESHFYGHEYVWLLCPYPNPPTPKTRRQSEYRLYLRVRALAIPVGKVDARPITVTCVEKQIATGAAW